MTAMIIRVFNKQEAVKSNLALPIDQTDFMAKTYAIKFWPDPKAIPYVTTLTRDQVKSYKKLDAFFIDVRGVLYWFDKAMPGDPSTFFD